MAGVVLKQLNGVFQTVIYTLIVTINTDRPVYRESTDAQNLFQLIHQIKGIAAVTVQLINKGKDRQMAAVAHPEQLFCLRFHTLGSVNQHYGTVGSHQRAVGILRKVLVTGGIKDVDTVAVIIKL